MKKIVIIGAGLSGLAAAFTLAEMQAHGEFDGEFLVLEASARTGGVISTRRRDGFLLETGADAFMLKKASSLDLLRRLGIYDQLISTNEQHRRAFILRHNRLRAIPQGFFLLAPSNVEAFFASDILSSHGKIRLANERFLPPAASPAPADETLADFTRRRFGEEALRRVAQPLFAGIYTADPEKLSIAATQPRFLELEQRYGSVIAGLEELNRAKIEDPNSTSGARYNAFLSFRDGMQTLPDALASNLPKDSIRLDARALTLNFVEVQRQWQINLENETLTADAVCLALPANACARLLETASPALARELGAIEHASTATINFGFRREQIAHSLDGFGFLVPQIEKRNLLAGTFASVKFPGRAPENHVLVRAFVGGALQPTRFELDDNLMIAGALNDLDEWLGVAGEPLFADIVRWRASMPQYYVGHLAKVAGIEKLAAALPNFALVTTGTDGVGVFDCVRRGEAAAESLAEILKT